MVPEASIIYPFFPSLAMERGRIPQNKTKKPRNEKEILFETHVSCKNREIERERERCGLFSYCLVFCPFICLAKTNSPAIPCKSHEINGRNRQPQNPFFLPKYQLGLTRHSEITPSFSFNRNSIMPLNYSISMVHLAITPRNKQAFFFFFFNI